MAGEAGAAWGSGIYRDEIDRILALPGCPGTAALDRSYIAPPQRR